MADEPVHISSFEDATPDPPTQGLPASIYEKLARLDIGGRIKAALHGSRQERQILIHDPNPLVFTAALQSPKLTLAEVEAITNMKNINQEILRIIGENREWTRHYGIILALVRNPKTPIQLSTKMVPRLMDRDVRSLCRDRTIPNAVRTTVLRIVQAKKP
ncbi:MAG: hypothetical protein HY644_11610 [Acidobacteria bacterium]|nr:hypothetical protein [Acidobacteriota bacterium]